MQYTYSHIAQNYKYITLLIIFIITILYQSHDALAECNCNIILNKSNTIDNKDIKQYFSFDQKDQKLESSINDIQKIQKTIYDYSVEKYEMIFTGTVIKQITFVPEEHMFVTEILNTLKDTRQQTLKKNNDILLTLQNQQIKQNTQNTEFRAQSKAQTKAQPQQPQQPQPVIIEPKTKNQDSYKELYLKRHNLSKHETIILFATSSLEECHIEPNKFNEYLFFAREFNDLLVIDSCALTRPLEDVPQSMLNTIKDKISAINKKS